MLIVITSILGLIIGSFVNAVVWRLKSGESIAKGRSMCPHCKHQLAARDLVPVVSWLWLRGTCRYCKKPIGVHYPLVELGTAVLFGLSALTFHPALQSSYDVYDWVRLGLWLVILTGVLILALYDAKWYEMPNKVMWPLVGLGVVYFAVRMMQVHAPWHVYSATLLATLPIPAAFWLLWWASKGRAMGGADWKLTLLMLLVLRPSALLVALFIGFMLGGVWAAGLLVRRRKGLRDQMPFGPFLAAGLIIAYLNAPYFVRLFEYLAHTNGY